LTSPDDTNAFRGGDVEPERARATRDIIDELPVLLLKDEVAALLRISVRTLDRLIAAGEFSGGVIKGKGFVRVSRTSVQRFLDARTDDANALTQPGAPHRAVSAAALLREIESRGNTM
jgi:excisionase family DNA binding protein